MTGKESDDSVIFELNEAKTYTVTAGKKTVEVEVKKAETKTATDTQN